jgi:hypothetical protein
MGAKRKLMLQRTEETDRFVSSSHLNSKSQFARI